MLLRASALFDMGDAMFDRCKGLLASVFFMGLASAAAAQSCGGTYVVQRGDSLSLIADALYKDVGKWTAIHQSNISTIGSNPERIAVGMSLNLTCIDGLPTGLEGGVDLAALTASAAAAQPLVVAPGNARSRSKINILTGTDFAPFTDSDLPNGGMLTEVVQAAMDEVNPEQGFAIHWVNDWGAHFEPLLSNALLDIGFPWFKPNCDAQPDTYRCQNLLFSDSMFEVLILLFVDTSRPFEFRTTDDIKGKRLCRPAGYATYIFDQSERNWLRDGVIELVVGDSPADCVEKVAEGEADAAVLNEFLGRQTVKDLGLKGQIDVAGGNPISIDGNYMVVHKSHPNGPELLAVFEEGLAKIKENGEYQRIVGEHMTRVWAEF